MRAEGLNIVHTDITVYVEYCGYAGARRVDMALYFPDQHGHECIVQAGILKGLGNELFKGGDLRCSFECVCVPSIDP